jgi:hypothetical protein
VGEMQVVVPLVNGGTLCNTLAIGERPQPPHQGGAVKGSHRNKKPAPGLIRERAVASVMG